jgi:hypothetical protein
MKPEIKKIVTRQSFPLIILGLIWLFIQCFFLWQNGIVTNQEAVKYINEANHFLKTGTFTTGNFLFYSTQILLIAFCIKLKINFLFIVILQILINGISIICFYKIVKNISPNKWIDWLSTFYFLIFYYYHLFNTYLFTESLFFSFSVIYTFFLFSLKKITPKKGIAIFLFLILLYVTRPTGIFFIPATYLFLIIKFYPKHAFKIIAVSSIFALAGLFFLFNFSLGSGGEFDFLLPYLDERIICGVSTISNAHHISIPVEKNSIQGLFYIITHHFDLFFSLSIKRLAAFFGVSRTYYSLFHNIFVSVYFYIIYLIIVIGIRNLFKINKAEVWFLITNIAFMAITVALSCDEWNNRFLFSVLPCFLLLAVISINNSKNKINAGKSYN